MSGWPAATMVLIILLDARNPFSVRYRARTLMGDQLVSHQAAERFLIGCGVDIIPFLQIEEVHPVRGTQAYHQVFALPLERRHLVLVPQDILAA